VKLKRRMKLKNGALLLRKEDIWPPYLQEKGVPIKFPLDAFTGSSTRPN